MSEPVAGWVLLADMFKVARHLGVPPITHYFVGRNTEHGWTAGSICGAVATHGFAEASSLEAPRCVGCVAELKKTEARQ